MARLNWNKTKNHIINNNYVLFLDNIILILLSHTIILKKKKVSLISENESVQLPVLDHVWLFVTPWTAPCQASLSCRVAKTAFFRKTGNKERMFAFTPSTQSKFVKLKKKNC